MENCEDRSTIFGTKFFYSLAEASALLDISENILLKYMANGSIDGLMFFGVKNARVAFSRFSVESLDQVYISFEDDDICEHDFDHSLNPIGERKSYQGYLKLSCADAKHLLFAGVCEQRRFIEILHRSHGYAEPRGRNRRHFAKKFFKSISQFPFYSFRSGDAPISGTSTEHRTIWLERPVIIRKEAVYVDLGELLYLIRNHYLSCQTGCIASIRYRRFFNSVVESEMGRGPRSLFDFERKAFHSQKLVDLIQVSIHFWSTIYFEFEYNEDITQKRIEIQNYLVGNYGFGRELAKAAVKIIFPPFAKHRPEVGMQLRNFGLPSSRLNVLITASDYFYSKIDLNNRESYPIRAHIEHWFKEIHGFPSYAVLAAAEIIEPSNEDVHDSFQQCEVSVI